jgi:hypothetical protein
MPQDSLDVGPTASGTYPVRGADVSGLAVNAWPADDVAVGQLGAIAFLENDPSPLSKKALGLMKELREVKAHPPRLAFLGELLTAVIAWALLVGDVALLKTQLWPTFGPSLGAWIAAAFAVGAALLLFVYLNIRKVLVTIDNGYLHVKRGLLFSRLQTIELWRVDEIQLKRSITQVITGYGTFVIRQLHRPDETIEVPGLTRRQSLDAEHEKLYQLVMSLRSNKTLQGVVA